MVDVPRVCGECVVTKQQRDPFPYRKSWRAKKALELVHSDICGPITPTSNGVYAKILYLCLVVLYVPFPNLPLCLGKTGCTAKPSLLVALPYSPLNWPVVWHPSSHYLHPCFQSLMRSASCHWFALLMEPTKSTGFVRGLGPDFSSFSTTQMAQTHLPCFLDLMSKAESFKLFQKSLESPTPSAVAFTANHGSSQRGGGSSRSRHGHENGSNHESSSHEQGRAQPIQ
uniref:Uncharacterized protein n=1 Tax=Vitis vinifera TaxID=29760 RepID=A5BHK8_VITVI|nr:hypothetical protein VITISV_017847 [Vitis vinifera]